MSLSQLKLTSSTQISYQPLLTLPRHENTTAWVEKQLLKTLNVMVGQITHISKREHIRCKIIRQMTRGKDIIKTIFKNKKCKTCHVASLPDNRWTIKTTNLYQYNKKRGEGWLCRRWESPWWPLTVKPWVGWPQTRKAWWQKAACSSLLYTEWKHRPPKAQG